jgi:hypothetical protein
VRLARLSPTGRLIAALALGPWLAAAVLWLAGVRLYAQRNLIEIGAFLAIAAAALVAQRAAARRRRRRRACARTPFCSFSLRCRTQASRRLVAEGWRPDDPVLVFGSPYALRSPLEWYLPRSAPRRVSARPTAAARAYVVAGSSGARLLAGDHRVLAPWVASSSLAPSAG